MIKKFIASLVICSLIGSPCGWARGLPSSFEENFTSTSHLTIHQNTPLQIETMGLTEVKTISISLSNLDLNSGEGFITSLGKNTVVMGASYGAAKLARTLGADDLVTSMVGTGTSLATSSIINTLLPFPEPPQIENLFPSGYRPTPSG